MKKVVILGAGMTGLTAAHYLQKNGIKPFLLEKKQVHGGLCRTEKKGGFLFDYSGHLLHFKKRNSQWKKFITNELKIPLRAHSRKASIYVKNNMIPYPFQYHLAYLPASEKRKCVDDFIKAARLLKQQKGEMPDSPSFYDWARKSFGERMYRLFFHPYNSKLWKFDLKDMTTLWMGRFVPPPDAEKILKGASIKDPSQDAGYNVNFHYPSSGGIGTVIDALAVNKNIIFNVEINKISVKEKKIYFDGGTMPYDHLVSTIPLPVLAKYLRGLPEVRKLSKQLRWISVKNTNLAVNKDCSKLGHWIYFPHRKLPFYRLGFLSNFSDSPEGYSNIYIETSYRKGKNPPASKSIFKFLKIPESKVTERLELDIPFAYVIYDRNREKVLPAVFEMLNNKNILSTGRYGGWK